MRRGCFIASVTACLVMALNTTRSIAWPLSAFFCLSTSQHVPGDRLALAIGVGRQDELVGALDRLGDVVEPLLRLGIDLPDHAEIGVGIDRAVLGRQVADMAERGQHLVAAAEIFIDRFRLGGRFYYYQIHHNPMIYRPFSAIWTCPDGFQPPGTWVMRPRLSNRYLRGREVAFTVKRRKHVDLRSSAR